MRTPAKHTILYAYIILSVSTLQHNSTLFKSLSHKHANEALLEIFF